MNGNAVAPEPGARRVRVALLGCGVVGSEVAQGLISMADEFTQRVGATCEIVGVAVLNPEAVRVVDLDPGLITTDAAALVSEADIVVEVMGGIEPARTLILQAIANGASVVTANKALLAQHGPELYEAADTAGVDLYFEASVGGAIPIIRPLRESLSGDRVNRVLGIVNGTTNFVLDEMTKTGADQDVVVAQAQALGYAESDPTADVDGFDAAAKAAILASIAFHSRVSISDVHREGIRDVTAGDVSWAAKTGYVVKLLAVAERVTRLEGEAIAVRVHPALVPNSHPLATVSGAYNAVFVETERAGNLMFYGQGAGGLPTSSAILGDIVTAARHRISGSTGPRESAYAALPIANLDGVRTRYQIRMDVRDQPGVLAQVAQVVASHGVSIETVNQTSEHSEGDHEGDANLAALFVVTHTANDDALATTVAALAELPVVENVRSVLRVVGA